MIKIEFSYFLKILAKPLFFNNNACLPAIGIFAK